MYYVGPFTARTRVRASESHAMAMARLMAELNGFAEAERARKHREFAGEMVKVPRQG
jgi:hypothetical protein